MAIANLHETLLSYTRRRNALNLQITTLQNRKNLAIYSQSDMTTIKAAREQEVREQYRAMYSDDPELAEKYKDYTEIPDFEEAMDKIAAYYSDEINDLTAWETQVDAQITTASAELEEVNAYIDSIKSMLSSNIQEDYSYGLGQ